MKYLTVGLTGPTGSGKSTVSNVFAQNGFGIIDCDRLSRIAVEPGGAAIKKLCEYFGDDILSPTGELIRPLVAQRAFSTAEGREKLNAAVHPAVLSMTREEIENNTQNSRHSLVDAPLLFEAEFDKFCDICVAVTAPKDVRIQRICARDGITQEAALLRMSAQHDESYYTAKSSYVLVNDGTVDELSEKAQKLCNDILSDSEAISHFS